MYLCWKGDTLANTQVDCPRFYRLELLKNICRAGLQVNVLAAYSFTMYAFILTKETYWGGLLSSLVKNMVHKVSTLHKKKKKNERSLVSCNRRWSLVNIGPKMVGGEKNQSEVCQAERLASRPKDDRVWALFSSPSKNFSPKTSNMWIYT